METETVTITNYSNEYMPQANYAVADTLWFETLAEAIEACKEMQARGEIAGYIVEAE